MIPKIIHYCWFGGNKKSAFIRSCIESWQKYMPDYKIRCWTEKDFDVNSVPFVKEAYEAKKWAFAADYVRFYALYTEGGIYLDTDVKVLKPFDEEWLHYDFFSGHEYHPGLFDNYGAKKLNSLYLPINEGEDIDGFSVNSAVMASKPNHPYVKDCLEAYNKMHFVAEDGSIKNIKEIIVGAIISRVAEKYGYVYQDKLQVLNENMLILPSNIFVGNSMLLDKDSYAIHLITGSWTEKNSYERFLFDMRHNCPQIYPLFAFVDKVLRKIQRMIK